MLRTRTKKQQFMTQQHQHSNNVNHLQQICSKNQNKKKQKHHFISTSQWLLLFIVLTDQYCGLIQVCGAAADNAVAVTTTNNNVHIDYLKAVSGRNDAVKLLEVGGRGLKLIKSLRASNQSDNCGADAPLHRLEWNDHFILASLKNRTTPGNMNYLCYESEDGTWKHLGDSGKFMR